MSNALVAGYDEDDPKCTQNTELLYANGTTKICKSTANYPENVCSLSGGSFLKNHLIVACGGNSNNSTATWWKVSSSCYSLNKDLKWTNFAKLTKPKEATASVIVKNGLWVTGNDEKFKYPSIKYQFKAHT